MRKIRVLHIIHGLNIGGAENFIFNIMRLLDSKNCIFDFAIQNPIVGHRLFEKEIRKRGGSIYLITDFRKNIFKQKKELSKILNIGYDFVHIHMNALINPIPALTASRYPCKVIIHSHNTSSAGGAIGNLLHILNRKLFLKDKFIRIACGTDAGKWMFGKKAFQVISNAVDLQLYEFDSIKRQQIREKYNLSDEFVIGHVGRVIPIKNQIFSVNLIKKFLEKNPTSNVRLMIVGDGEDLSVLKDMVEKYHISDRVIFTGLVNNSHLYYSSFDCLILPSLFEGFAFVAVEAQAAGLKVIASDRNTKEINISGYVSLHSLDNYDEWIEKLVECSEPYNRKVISDKLAWSMFDNRKLRSIIEELYGE